MHVADDLRGRSRRVRPLIRRVHPIHPRGPRASPSSSPIEAPMNRRTLIVLLAVLLGGAGCGHAGQEGDEAPAPRRSPITLVLSNQNFADMTIYSVEVGRRARVGMVGGNSSATLNVSSSFFPGGRLNLVAVPIGGSGRAGTGPLMVNGGETVYFTITPQLSTSYASVQ